MNPTENQIIKVDIESIISMPIGWQKLRNKTILITGATGMLATYIVYTLVALNRTKELNIKIIALARSERKMFDKFGEFINTKEIYTMLQDVCNPIELQENIDYIFHLAGSASATAISESPVDVIKANTIGTINVFEVAKNNKAKVVFISTREVYGAVDKTITSIDENDTGVLNDLDSRSSYPGSKRIAETICRSYSDQYNIPFLILRVAHSYGPMMSLDNDGRVMADLISDVVSGRDITLLSSGEALRAFCYITDATTGIFSALLNGEDNQAYNLANEREPISILNLAKLLISFTPEQKLSITHKTPTERELNGYAKFDRVTLNTAKLEATGWVPTVSLKTGVSRVIDYNINRVKQ